MTVRTRTASVLILALAATAAAAQSGVPTLNLSGSCRALDRKDFSIQIDTQRCLKTENEARTKLVEDWAKYSAADRSLCTQTARMGGVESYVQLLTCLELQHDRAAGPSGRNQSANRPAAGPQMRTRPTGLPGQ
jgi:hypothetical protein